MYRIFTTILQKLLKKSKKVFSRKNFSPVTIFINKNKKNKKLKEDYPNIRTRKFLI